YDGLTELPNRALFRDRLQQALARSGRSGSPLAVLLVDLDGFKQVNDSLGHDAGDQLLEAVAERFTETSRPSDTLARLGGDEFALLLDGAHETHAVGVARRLLVALEEPIWIAGRELVVGASIGIALHAGGAGEGEELVRHADVAMYAAKEAGRGRFEVFRYDMARELGELLGLEHELRLGLQRGEFVLHYQPEVDLENGAIVGVEALLRWNSPRRGVVPPDRFISVAEATGLILPLGAFVLREACLQTARWRAEGVLPEKFVTWVNLSGRQLAGAGIGAVVRGALEEAALPPTYPGREATETAPRHGGGGGGGRPGGGRGGALAGRAAGAARGRRPDRDRRLRHRLLVTWPAPPLPGGHDQGRPLFHPGHGGGDERRGDRCQPGDLGARPGRARDRRGHRVERTADLATRSRLRPRARLPVRKADAGRPGPERPRRRIRRPDRARQRRRLASRP